MKTIDLAVALLLLAGTAALAGQPRHDVRTWSFEVSDPSRPGRVVGVLAHGPADPAQACPLLVFGHATMIPVTHYDSLAIALAAAGWLVLMPDTEMGLPADQAALAADMGLLADLARHGSAQLPQGLPAVSGDWALAGHSLGGGAAVLAAAAAVDPPQALVLLAPQVRERPSALVHARAVESPALMLSGEHDCLTPPEHHHWPLHEALAGTPRVLATLLGGGHCNFAAPCEPCQGGEASCGQHLTADQQQALALGLVAPWLAWQVTDDAAAREAFLAALADPQLDADLVDEVAVSATLPTTPRLRLLGAEAGGGGRWRLEQTGTGRPAAARLFDVRGRRIADLAITPAGGAWDLRWDGLDTRGRGAPSGVYLLRVEAGSAALSSRLVKLD